MARTTDEKVRAIMDVDATITDLSPFIEAANGLVTELCAASSYSDTRLENIETWLAAHFAASRDPRFQSEGLGEGVNYNKGQKLGMYLKNTTYGQNAMLLDTAGNLASLDEGPQRKVTFTWLGTSPD